MLFGKIIPIIFPFPGKGPDRNNYWNYFSKKIIKIISIILEIMIIHRIIEIILIIFHSWGVPPGRNNSGRALASLGERSAVFLEV